MAVKFYCQFTFDTVRRRIWFNDNGVIHREDGPAVICANRYKAWVLHGIPIYDFREFIKQTPISEEEKAELVLIYG